ncbi:hypothetical protein OG806_49395 [Streptomyces sp. NBC_00882]|nr:hypothetical protein OG806_49395 [Streptomyces sp. NBC_00882]WSZ63822.1 hypothetical protein OH824_48670 [Streptomyces canus]
MTTPCSPVADGRLQYYRALDWTHSNKLKRTIEITPTGDLKAG